MTNLPGPYTSLVDYFEQTFVPSQLAGKDGRYSASYETALDRLVSFFRRDPRINEVTEEVLADFYRWLIESQRVAASGAPTYVKRIRRIVRYATGGAKFSFCHHTIHDAAAPVGMSPDTIEGFLYQVYVVERSLAEESERQLALTASQFNRWAGHPVKFSELPDALNEWLKELQDAGENTPRTIKAKRDNIRMLWRYAADKGHAPTYTGVRKLKVPKPIPKAWSLDELRLIILACRQLEGYLLNGIQRAAFFEGLVRVIYDTALRRADVLALRTDQLGEDGTISLVQHKTGDGHIVRLREETAVFVRTKLFPPDRELIFAWPYLKQTLMYNWRKILTKAGLPTGPKEGLQKLRRTSVSHLERVNAGVASAHLGHRTPGQAKDHYIDSSIAYRQRPLPPAIDGKEGAA